MNKTEIPWVKNPDGSPGYTWDTITGCLNHINGMCKGGNFPCYAHKLAQGRLKKRYLANENVSFLEIRDVFDFYPRFNMDRLVAGDAFLKAHKKPVGVFPCSMSDWCGVGIPESWSNWILEMARRYPRHRFYLLTKQAQNLAKFSPFPDNCWPGVMATDESSFVEAYNRLICIEARVKYISLEPFLEWGRLYEKHACKLSFLLGNKYDYPNNGIDWLIIGALTGTKSDLLKLNNEYPQLTLMQYGNKWTLQPKIEYVKEIVEAADKAGVKVFLKDSLMPLLEPHGKEAHFFNYSRNTLRQEMPA